MPITTDKGLEAGLIRVFDPDENRTRVWDSKGFRGYETGNTEKMGTKTSTDTDFTVRDSKGNIDPERTGRNVLLNAIPAAITAALPESRALSPLMNVLKRFGIGMAGTTIADQGMNLIPGMEQKPLMNSVVGAAGTNLGASLPELANQALGLRLGPKINSSVTTSDPTVTEMIGNIVNEMQSRRSTTGTTTGTGNSSGSGTSSGEYSNSGKSLGNSNGEFSSITDTTSGIPRTTTQQVPKKPERNAKGQFIGGFIPGMEDEVVQLPGYSSNSETIGTRTGGSNSTNQSSGTRSGQSGSESHYQNMTDIINEAIQNAITRGERTGTSTTTPGRSTTTSTGSWPGPLGILQAIKLNNGAAPKIPAAGLGFLLNSLADQMSGNNQKQ